MKRETREVPMWEWMVALFGLLLILSIFSVLGREALTGARTPPVIELRVQKAVPHGSGELLLIDVHNRGGEVAADLKVRGSINNGSTVIETREVTIDHLPRGSRKTVGLFFSRPVGNDQLQLEPIGFVKP